MTSQTIMFIFLMLMILSIMNCYFIHNYFIKYSSTFNHHNVIENVIETNQNKGYCFNYFNIHARNPEIYDNRIETLCFPYSHEYVLFILEKAQYVNNYIIMNIGFIIIICSTIIYKYT